MTLIGVPIDRRPVKVDALKKALTELGVIGPAQNWDEVERIDLGPAHIVVHCMRADPDQSGVIRWEYPIRWDHEPSETGDPEPPKLSVVPDPKLCTPDGA